MTLFQVLPHVTCIANIRIVASTKLAINSPPFLFVALNIDIQTSTGIGIISREPIDYNTNEFAGSLLPLVKKAG